ncbi:glycoside hydrolase superfamily [Lyophyllum atratum]|nr:glycoside hydrolase superfamily [Lyophyllum atratum]
MNRVILCLLTIFSTHVLAVNHFAGITVSNSNGGTSAYTCRTQAQWNDLAKNIKAAGFPSLRILGSDCDAFNRASGAAAAEGLTVLAGIYISGNIASSIAATNEGLKSFRNAYAKYGPGRYVGLTIGNEVNDNPSAVIAEVDRARDYLRKAGVSTRISTAHTWVAIRNSPHLCDTDFVAANAHAFYDGKVAPGDAGNFVMKVVVPALKAACPGKDIIITETGWPSRGSAQGTDASLSAERQALANINCASRDNTKVSVYAFEYDDQNWKSNDNERSFGIFGKLDVKKEVLDVC